MKLLFATSLLALLPLLVSCQTKSAVRREQELERIKQEVSASRGDKADFEVALEEVKTQLSRQASATDELIAQNRNQLEELKKELAAVSTRLQAFEQRALQDEIAEKRAVEERSRATYDNAKKLFDEGQFEESATVLRAVIQKNPKSDEAKKSRFLLAECYFSSKDFASAAIEFAEFKKEYPKDTLIPVAIYRQANAFKLMGKKNEAKLFYQELIEKHPKNALTAKARQESRKLK